MSSVLPESTANERGLSLSLLCKFTHKYQPGAVHTAAAPRPSGMGLVKSAYFEVKKVRNGHVKMDKRHRKRSYLYLYLYLCVSLSIYLPVSYLSNVYLSILSIIYHINHLSYLSTYHLSYLSSSIYHLSYLSIIYHIYLSTSLPIYFVVVENILNFPGCA